jgi:uncharacterized protein (DUF885 family)
VRFLLLWVVGSLMGCSSLSISSETSRFNKYLDEEFEKGLENFPEMYTYLGLKKKYNQLNNYTEAYALKMHELAQKELADLQQFRFEKLDESAQLSYRLYKKALEDSIADFEWRNHSYVVTQFYGFHSDLPAFLMNYHVVDNKADLEDYIARLRELKRVTLELLDQIQSREQQGIIPPRFVYDYVIEASQNIIKGAPFDGSATPSPLYEDFVKKAKALKLSQKTYEAYDKQAQEALIKNVRPAYLDFITAMQKQKKKSQGNFGVWKLKKGKDFYKTLVQRHTTTDFTPEQIHQMGLAQVKRLQNEMRQLLKEMNFKGSLQDYFTKLREDDAYYFANTPEGGEAYLALSKKYYADIQPLLPQYFRLMPKAPFEIRAVEKFRESSAGIAFYEHPSEDGRRPGVYYVNLRNMRDLPKHEAQVILYHEGAPGHHFQIALAQELKGVPQFRRYNNYTAYAEGWGLYTERLTGEMGLFKDLESQFGKLSLELLRASRLVLDTGIHAKKWTREQALDYMKKNVSGSLQDQKNEIERYFVMPGQATAYMVGMLKIIELREMARKELGGKFDIRDFHDVVLGAGPMPLSELEQNIKKYVQQKNTEVKK